LGAGYFVGGRDFVNFALAYMRRWNTAWMMLSFLAFYLIACEITDTQWFRQFGIEMIEERLQALFLALVLGSFFLIAPFRAVWTNYWLLRDGRQVRAVVTDVRQQGSVGYRYRVNGNEYTTSAYCPHQGRVSCFAGESITAYYSASHPSVSRIEHTESMGYGAWPAMIIFTWPFEFMAIATVVSPRCKWAYRFGSRNVLPPHTVMPAGRNRSASAPWPKDFVIDKLKLVAWALLLVFGMDAIVIGLDVLFGRK
jgi:uncharacterized protein DUF3592